MSILIRTVRVFGLRGLQNIEVNLEDVTVLTGMNNSGKTTFLKALQIVFGNRQFITKDDFYVSDGQEAIDKIVIDVKIVPVEADNKICSEFSDVWEELFTTQRLKLDDSENYFVPLRTIVIYDIVKANYIIKQYILPDWPPFKTKHDEVEAFWYNMRTTNETNFYFNEIPFFYIDAKRDIVEDIKLKASYLGKMISKIDYDEEDINEIEEQIELLNKKAVDKSPILTNIKTTLKDLDTAISDSNSGIEITPFTKKLRDLNKGFTIYYGDNKHSFPMEYHGMGTRSWSSLLTIKSFLNMLTENAKEENSAFYPILAIEEPETHIHPNAQKKLFNQINNIKGQKIIATHSPYIAACCELNQLRNFYKDDESLKCGTINTSELDEDDIRRINTYIRNSKGELFFSNAVILFEGETEEMALPIFAKYYFDRNPVELGIDFVGVGGSGNYLPFLRVVEALNIPWFILSDGEKKAINDVKSSMKKLYGNDVVLDDKNNIHILENGCNFEKYLLQEGYIDEIIQAIEKIHGENYLTEYIRQNDGRPGKSNIKTDKICDKCKQNIYMKNIKDYKGDKGFKNALYDCMCKDKPQFGYVIANIINNNKSIPAKISKLFDDVNKFLERGVIDESNTSIT